MEEEEEVRIVEEEEEVVGMVEEEEVGIVEEEEVGREQNAFQFNYEHSVNRAKFKGKPPFASLMCV